MIGSKKFNKDNTKYSNKKNLYIIEESSDFTISNTNNSSILKNISLNINNNSNNFSINKYSENLSIRNTLNNYISANKSRNNTHKNLKRNANNNNSSNNTFKNETIDFRKNSIFSSDNKNTFVSNIKNTSPLNVLNVKTLEARSFNTKHKKEIEEDQYIYVDSDNKLVNRTEIRFISLNPPYRRILIFKDKNDDISNILLKAKIKFESFPEYLNLSQFKIIKLYKKLRSEYKSSLSNNFIRVNNIKNNFNSNLYFYDYNKIYDKNNMEAIDIDINKEINKNELSVVNDIKSNEFTSNNSNNNMYFASDKKLEINNNYNNINNPNVNISKLNEDKDIELKEQSDLLKNKIFDEKYVYFCDIDAYDKWVKINVEMYSSSLNINFSYDLKTKKSVVLKDLYYNILKSSFDNWINATKSDSKFLHYIIKSYAFNISSVYYNYNYDNLQRDSNYSNDTCFTKNDFEKNKKTKIIDNTLIDSQENSDVSKIKKSTFKKKENLIKKESIKSNKTSNLFYDHKINNTIDDNNNNNFHIHKSSLELKNSLNIESEFNSKTEISSLNFSDKINCKIELISLEELIFEKIKYFKPTSLRNIIRLITISKLEFSNFIDNLDYAVEVTILMSFTKMLLKNEFKSGNINNIIGVYYKAFEKNATYMHSVNDNYYLNDNDDNNHYAKNSNYFIDSEDNLYDNNDNNEDRRHSDLDNNTCNNSYLPVMLFNYNVLSPSNKYLKDSFIYLNSNEEIKNKNINNYIEDNLSSNNNQIVSIDSKNSDITKININSYKNKYISHSIFNKDSNKSKLETIDIKDKKEINSKFSRNSSLNKRYKENIHNVNIKSNINTNYNNNNNKVNSNNIIVSTITSFYKKDNIKRRMKKSYSSTTIGKDCLTNNNLKNVTNISNNNKTICNNIPDTNINTFGKKHFSSFRKRLYSNDQLVVYEEDDNYISSRSSLMSNKNIEINHTNKPMCKFEDKNKYKLFKEVNVINNDDKLYLCKTAKQSNTNIEDEIKVKPYNIFKRTLTNVLNSDNHINSNKSTNIANSNIINIKHKTDSISLYNTEQKTNKSSFLKINNSKSNSGIEVDLKELLNKINLVDIIYNNKQINFIHTNLFKNKLSYQTREFKIKTDDSNALNIKINDESIENIKLSIKTELNRHLIIAGIVTYVLSVIFYIIANLTKIAN